MMLVLYAIPLAALAVWRARQHGPLVTDRRYCLGLIAYGAAVLAFAHFETFSMREALGFAFLFVCAWSDLVARKVYLPVSIAALFGAGATAFMGGEVADALVGAGLLGGASLAVFLLARGKAWGFGDVFVAAVVGAAFGPVSGILTFALGFIVGALIATPLVLSGRVSRADPLPMGTFVAAGSVTLAIARGIGWNLA